MSFILPRKACRYTEGRFSRKLAGNSIVSSTLSPITSSGVLRYSSPNKRSIFIKQSHTRKARRDTIEYYPSKPLVQRREAKVAGEHNKLIKKLAKLRVDRSKGVAPHKPLLLLVLLELAKSESLPDTNVVLTPEIAFRFSVYWSIVAHRRTQPPDLRLPSTVRDRQSYGQRSKRTALNRRTANQQTQ